ncbi:MAG: HAD hydrolase-like protein [Chloroflexi bacterium]|nr:HAD hydrolase-like protein [Chloroflexota bacterium]
MRPSDIPEVTIEELIERYSVLLLDSYGVLVHSSRPVPGAVELIAALNRIGKSHFVLTNDASTLPENRAIRFKRAGLDIEADRIISSGILLAGYFEESGLIGAPCIVLGPEDSRRYVEIAGGRVVSPSQDFEALIVGDQSGFQFLETLDRVLSALIRKIDRGESVHLILPNPDIIFPSEAGFGFASASIALMFEAALALRYPDRNDLRFQRLGKPHTVIFEEALRRSGTMDMVMIGDQLETDIKGANAFGIASALVDTGVVTGAAHIPSDARPTYRLRSLMPARLRR